MTQTHSSPAAILSNETAPNNDQPERVYSTAEICKLIDCHRVTLWRMCRDGRFPKPLEIMPNKRGWLRSDYDNWLAGHIAKRDGK